MIRLRNWHLIKRFNNKKEVYYAIGIISGHSEIEDGNLANTSKIEKLSLVNNSIVMITHSKNEYVLDLCELNRGYFNEVSNILNKFGIKVDKDYCNSLIEKCNKELFDRIDSILNKNELYIILSGVHAQRAFFKNDIETVREVSIHRHITDSQDSYLILGSERNEIDFRYFNKIMAIEPYSWSNNIVSIKFENIGSNDIKFEGNKDIIIKVNGITSIDRLYYYSKFKES